jgi:hypothetical protein
MNPTRRLSTILAIATVAIAGAGIALASVGGSTTDASATPVANADAYATDPSEIRSLTRTLSRLDGRSDQLDALLAELRGKSQQVSERGVTTVSVGSSDDGPATAVAPTATDPSTPSPAATHDDDDYDDGYEDEYEDDDHEDDEDDDEDEGDDD